MTLREEILNTITEWKAHVPLLSESELVESIIMIIEKRKWERIKEILK